MGFESVRRHLEVFHFSHEAPGPQGAYGWVISMCVLGSVGMLVTQHNRALYNALRCTAMLMMVSSPAVCTSFYSAHPALAPLPVRLSSLPLQL